MILVAIAMGVALPILPTQILWINMTTAVALGLMLAFEPKEAGIMNRPPRDPAQPLLTRALLVRDPAGCDDARRQRLVALRVGVGKRRRTGEARTAALNLFVVVEAFYLFSCRSLTHSVWRIGFFSNRWIILGLSVQALAQLAITYLPVMNTLFGTAPIGLSVWLRVFAAIALLVTVVVGIDKVAAPAATEPGLRLLRAGADLRPTSSDVPSNSSRPDRRTVQRSLPPRCSKSVSTLRRSPGSGTGSTCGGRCLPSPASSIS